MTNPETPKYIATEERKGQARRACKRLFTRTEYICI